ncbi:hypothetical protein Bca52824_015001 [Brassica carinata]|uniref:Replication factor A C-terminal domain-containing protein n=1 Tax=Brassica carinata TaxID=52824 RepID=A0A8X8B4Y6_BRACI|nr:hypothetical protein Bca52824_015001 [Brassica carinata]
MSKKRNDSSSAVDRKKVTKTDVSSTPMESKRHCPDSGDHKSVIDTEGSSAMGRRSDPKNDGSSKPMVADDFSRNVVKPTVQGSVSSALSTKRHGKGVVSDERCADIMLFADVTQGPHEAELRFRLIHFWEAQNPLTKVLIGEEMLLIDEKGNVIQGFIPASRVQTYLREMTAFGLRSKVQFRVADHNVTVSFSWNIFLTPLQNSPVPFPEDRLRFHDHEEFEANCGLKGDLYDYVGHMRLINGQAMTVHPTIDEVDIAEKRHLVVHVQTHDGPVMKLYLWDQAATAFCQKFKSYGSTPRVLLVTTVNPKRIGGTLALTSMTSSKVFMDIDVQPTRDYLNWLGSNSGVANEVIADVVTNPETVTLATIDDVLHGFPRYYISCGGCNTKATKGSTSLVCTNKKCAKSEVVGVPQYLTKISVYDKSEQAMFVLLGDAGRELTGKHASELVARYFELNEDVGADQTVPIPQTLMDTIGQTHKFVVKVSQHNLTGKTQTITVTKVLPAPAPQNAFEDPADERIIKASGSLDSQEAKRAKSG